MPKVFLIEDVLELSRLYERVFRLSGFAVELSGNGAEALERLFRMSELPDVIVLDVMIPEVNGIDVLRKLKQDDRLAPVPVIVITNSFAPENEDLFRSLGARMYLMKMDHEPSALVAKVNMCMTPVPPTAPLSA